MTFEINALNGVASTSYTAGASAPEKNLDINFAYGADENFVLAQVTKRNILESLAHGKAGMKLVEPFLFGEDHVIVAGDGKMTLGELRQKYGIPPRVLSKVNGQNLKDSDIVKDIKINLSDMGWYELDIQSNEEAADYRAQRAGGNPYAGYDRAITNEEIKKLLK